VSQYALAEQVEAVATTVRERGLAGVFATCKASVAPELVTSHGNVGVVDAVVREGEVNCPGAVKVGVQRHKLAAHQRLEAGPPNGLIERFERRLGH